MFITYNGGPVFRLSELPMGAPPAGPPFLDSRGLVHLRLGDLDNAIADYDRALTANPRLAWSLYGRGIAKLRRGFKDEGQSDLASATALNPKLPDEARRFGIVPPA